MSNNTKSGRVGPKGLSLTGRSIKTVIVDDEDDFGFSFEDRPREPLEPAPSERAELLLAAILPFLDNLSKNPDKPNIHWPNRVEKIEQFKSRLEHIVRVGSDPKHENPINEKQSTRTNTKKQPN